MAFESSSDAARKSPPCALVIFGASGDLTQRKLHPGHRATGPPRSAAAGVRPGRRRPLADVRRGLRATAAGTRQTAEGESSTPGPRSPTIIRYVCGGYDDPDTYDKLADVLHDCRPHSRDRRQPRLLLGDASHRLRHSP